MVSFTTLVSFDGTTAGDPLGSLLVDAAGDLFGTTDTGGSALNTGTVFELVKTADGYTPTTLLQFAGAVGQNPNAGVIADATGDLFGTTAFGGSDDNGVVFELAKTAGGYTPSTLVNFTFPSDTGAEPLGALLADSAGDLFGTTAFGGTNAFGSTTNLGTVFELVKTATGYEQTTLLTFTGSAHPEGALLTDAAGDLFGTTAGDLSLQIAPTVFELVKTAGGYTPTTLMTFSLSNVPAPNLISDAAGDLFGTTTGDGSSANDGTVFELVKTAGGYTPVTLATFNGANGSDPQGALLMDAAGDLFGTTATGGSAANDGSVFELVKTADGYTLTTLFAFNGANGELPQSGLVADAAGDLFGTTETGGATGSGTVFEITNSGFVISATPAPAITGLVGQPTNGQTVDVTGTGQAGDTVTLYADGGTTAVGTGVVASDGAFDITSTSTFADGAHTLTATETDASNVTSASSSGFLVDVLPTSPTIAALVGQPANGQTIDVTGTGEAGETVTLYADGASTAVGSGVVAADGTFNITTSATFADGDHSLAATQTDSAGLVSAASTAFAVAVIPNPPSGLSLDASTDSGAKGDGLTNIARVMIDGSAPKGSSVSLYDGATLIGTGTASATTGLFSILSSSALVDGSHTITAKDADAAGLTSLASPAISVTVDAHPALAAVSTFAVTPTKGAETVSLSGTSSDAVAGVGYTIGIFEDGKQVGTVTPGAGGAWSFSQSGVSNAVHTYSLQTTDAAANTGAGSNDLVIGSTASDTIVAGSGNNLIFGGPGADTLTGGSAGDTFIFNSTADFPFPSGKGKAVETITDWAPGADHINLTAFGHLTFDGQTQSVAPMSVEWYVSGGDTFIIGDVLGHTHPDFMIELLGVHTLASSDFFLG